MAISASDVAALRKQTGAGMMDCKKALVATEGNFEKAVEWLQKKSLAAVGKRASKVAAEGTIVSYVHGGRIGVLLEVNCETDFVGRGEDFQEMARNIAMHIAASAPQYIEVSEIPEEYTAKQAEIFLAQLAGEKKPQHILEKIVEGRVAKWQKEICLLEQDYVRDPDLTVGEYVASVASTTKENIKVRRFTRYELGDGIERETSDFASEVAAATQV